MEAALLQQILTRLGQIEQHLGIQGSSSGAESTEVVLPPAIRGFDQYCAAALDPFVAATKKLGGEAEAAGKIIHDAWMEMRAFLLMASKCKEPGQAQLPPLLQGVSAQMKAATALVKRNEWEKHTKTCSEGIGCLNWLVVKPAPRDFIESFVGGSDYWANGIRKEYRTTNPDQIAFCDTFKTLLTDLMAYVKEYHTTGVKWNPQGIDTKDYNPGEAAAAPAPTAAAPAATASASSTGAVNIFADLNKEGAVTSGLKKVTKDMQTWRAEYKGGDAPVPAAPAPKAAAKPAAAPATKGPPKLVYLEGPSKWEVENQTSAQGLVQIDLRGIKDKVYIFGCVDATIVIKGKCNTITVDSCKKTKVYFDNVMASVEVVNSQRMQVHCLEAVSSVAIDKTDGIQVFLPTSSLSTKVVTSKSSEMNLCWPDANGDIIEKPIPEQYVHFIKDGAVTAEVSDLYTA